MDILGMIIENHNYNCSNLSANRQSSQYDPKISITLLNRPHNVAQPGGEIAKVEYQIKPQYPLPLILCNYFVFVSIKPLLAH